jgi:hypothetical protein
MTEQREMPAYVDALTEETLNSTIRYVIPGAVRECAVVDSHPTAPRSTVPA